MPQGDGECENIRLPRSLELSDRMPEASQQLRWLREGTPPEYAPKEAHPDGMPAKGPRMRQRSRCMLICVGFRRCRCALPPACLITFMPPE
jgi:hypothetical protein